MSIIEFHIILNHFRNTKIAIGVIIAIRLTVWRIPQPPRASVRRMPRALLSDTTVHCIILAAAATILAAGDIHDQGRFSRIVCEILAQGVVHEGPVVLVAR